VAGQRELLQLSFCNLPALAVYFLIELSFHTQPSGSFRASDECKHHLKTAQRLASPVYADVTEQPMFHRVPFGATCRIFSPGGNVMQPHSRKRFLHVAAGDATLATVSGIAKAQTYPTQHLRLYFCEVLR